MQHLLIPVNRFLDLVTAWRNRRERRRYRRRSLEGGLSWEGIDSCAVNRDPVVQMVGEKFVTIDCGHGMRVRARLGASVLQACLREGLALANACGGKGRCTTCRVRVESGLESCPAPDEVEREALTANGLESPIRLACQLRPEADIGIRVLIPTHDESPRGPIDVREEDIAVVFTDIRGFTTFAENHLPFDVCSVLDRYFDLMGVIVERHAGIVMDYLGDGIVSVFRPDEGESPARRAAGCALDMRRAAHTFGTFVQEYFDSNLAVGIAVHGGPAVVGDMGYFRSRRFNAVGDVLNVAARLEDFNKECGTDVLITERISSECRDLVHTGRAFELQIRGRTTPVKAVEVLGRAGE